MKLIRSLTIAAVLTIAALLPTTAGSLREDAATRGFDWLVGTWGDKDTKGGTIKFVYEWRLDGHAIGVRITTPDRNVEGLIARNAKTSEVGYVVADNQGGGAIGKLVIKDGAVVIKLAYHDGNDSEGKLALTHEKKDADNVKFLLSELSDSGEILSTKQEIELVRLK